MEIFKGLDIGLEIGDGDVGLEGGDEVDREYPNAGCLQPDEPPRPDFDIDDDFLPEVGGRVWQGVKNIVTPGQRPPAEDLKSSILRQLSGPQLFGYTLMKAILGNNAPQPKDPRAQGHETTP